MRWGTKRPGHKRGANGIGRTVPDSTAAIGAAASEEARKGTAAADPVIGVTPEGQALPGAVVDGEFVAAADTAPARVHDQQDADDPVAAGEKPGENERMRHVWWVGRAARGGRH